MADPILEAMADQAHDSWAGWTKWMLEKIDQVHPSGESYRERWARQIQAPYAELPEDEKESDRIEARKFLAICESVLRMAGIPCCPVCGKDARRCQHTADEFYEARIKELQRSLQCVQDGYRGLYEWSQQERLKHREMKNRIKELEAQNASLRKRLVRHQEIEVSNA